MLASTPPNPCPSQVLHDNLLAQVSRANHAFRAAGVQFFIRAIECYTAADFHSPGGSEKQWAAVYPQLGGAGKALPDMPSDAWGATTSKTTWEWLGATATQWGRTDEILIWMKQNGGGHAAALPWRGREVVMDAPTIAAGAGPQALAHELGHLFGLVHPHDIEAIVAATDPRDTLARDPQTLVHYQKADFWDLVFRPGTTAHTFFTTRSLAVPYEASLRQIVTGDTAQGNSNCVQTQSPPMVTCTVSTAGGNGSGSNVQQYDSNDPELRGLSFFAGAHFYTNACSYLPDTAQDPRFFSESEVLMIRKHLRWDSTYDYTAMNFSQGA